MKDIFSELPRIQNKGFSARKITKDDVNELYEIYSNSETLINKDNYYRDFNVHSLDEMKEFILYWSRAYKYKWFTRLTITDLSINKIIGSMELILRRSFDSFDEGIILRLEILPEYENKESIESIIGLAFKIIKRYFGKRKIITKNFSSESLRTHVLNQIGFTESKRKILGENNINYSNYLTIVK